MAFVSLGRYSKRKKGRRTHEGEHLPDSVLIPRHRKEEGQHLKDLLDVRDELVGDERDLLSLLLRDLDELDRCCESEPEG